MRRRWMLGIVMAAGWRSGAGQASVTTWITLPAGPTVGDTVWIERHFSLAPGWRLRPGRLESGDDVESLGDAVIVREGTTWIVRYPATTWSPGPRTVAMPPVWRLGPDAQADSVLGGTATFVVNAVIPDSIASPAPRPALDPLRTERRAWLPVLLTVTVVLGSMAGALWWRRRPPRAAPVMPSAVPKPGIGDTRWLDAGEARAVATRASNRLRVALAATVPEAHLGLSTTDCLAAARRARPGAFDEVADVLGALDQVAFASRSTADVVQLANRARALAGALKR
jgi:hypothetical protein